MKIGYQITFFTLQSRQHDGQPITDWLQMIAQEAGISGVTVTNAAKGLGHDGTWHSASFFELADQPIEIVMITDEQTCINFFTLLEVHSPKIFYTKSAIEYGII